MSDDDGGNYGGPSGRLFTSLWPVPRHTSITQPSSLGVCLAVLHGSVDGRSAGSISFLPRTSTWHLLGLVQLRYLDPFFVYRMATDLETPGKSGI